ncbi:MAG: ABC transporter permease [Methanobacteriaceae archaeon]|nr:ABC transporter permease [Methanobacteriaceae archaeon]
MKFISIAIKDAKELIRDRRGLFMILIFPLFFMLVFGFAFGGMGQSNTPHKIAVINNDEGVYLPFIQEEINFGNNLTKILEDSKYENSDVNLFKVTKTNETAADELLKQREIDAAIIIPKNSSKAIAALISSSISPNTNLQSTNQISDNETATIIIKGDTGYVGFGISQGIIVGILEQYQDQLLFQIQSSLSSKSGYEQLKFIESKVEPLEGTETFTSFDFLAPGMIVFAILLLATTVAASLTREVEKGTLDRLKLSYMKSFDLLMGGLIPWSLVAAVQVIILFVVAVLIGFHWQGGLNSLILAIFVGIVGGIGSVALGMIIAAFAKTERQAANLGTIITVPTSFLVGAFFELPQVVIGNFMGQSFQIYDFLPWTHTLNALRTLLTFGGDWNDITYQLGLSTLLTLLLFILGVFLFSRNRLGAES